MAIKLQFRHNFAIASVFHHRLPLTLFNFLWDLKDFFRVLGSWIFLVF